MFWRMILVLALSIGASVFAASEPMRASKPAVRKQVLGVIDAQLAALRKHDMERAFALTSSQLQRERPLPLFSAIVRANYPEIWNNERAEYGIVHDDGRTATVLVHVFAEDQDAAFDYTLVQESGVWRVLGILRHAPNPEAQL